jgi:2-succinyl-5-enolpyruvyl-6-hydroxy-3-cyclohexene-1-carboxylate synthase
MSTLRNPNRRMGQAIAEELERSGVVTACISPGSRSTALALALAAAHGIRVFVVTDERSSGFFALGLAREERRPVALLCTSGTAAANYLPAVVEASLAHVPLIVLTADRPPELRDCGAPQTIAQASLFAGHVRWSFDVPVPTGDVDLDRLYRTLACRAVAAALEWPGGPVHLNLPMREPLLDVEEEVSIVAVERAPVDIRPFTTVHPACAVTAPETLERLARTLEGRERGLIVGGPDTDRAAADEIARLARVLRWPILADPLSGLRFGPHDRSALVDGYDVLLRDREFAAAHIPDAILQIGSLPASKALAVFLAEAPRGCHVVVAPPGSWPDPLHRATDVVRAAPHEFCVALAARLPVRPAPSPWLDDWLENSAALRAALGDEIAAVDEVLEGKLFPLLCERLPAGSLVVLGNSMPVRDADTFLGSSDRAVRFCGNRGASGIDGVMSSALGAAAARHDPTVLVVGDLSFLHDLGALQIAARHAIPLLIVAVHNDGGGIFSFLPQASLEGPFDTLFATPHGLALEPAVRMCGGRHVRVASWGGFVAALDAALAEGGLRVVELASDRGRNRTLHERTIAAALERLRRRREEAA